MNDLIDIVSEYNSFDTLVFLRDDKFVVYKDINGIEKFDELFYDGEDSVIEVLEEHYGVSWF